MVDDRAALDRVLALAREALEMRGRGPFWYTIRHDDGSYLDGEDCIWDRAEEAAGYCYEGDVVVPLYAGPPVSP